LGKAVAVDAYVAHFMLFRNVRGLRLETVCPKAALKIIRVNPNSKKRSNND
jgi:hypothetical protein